MSMDFINKLDVALKKNNSLLCISLDPMLERLPETVKRSETPYFDFNKIIIDSTHDLVCAYKPNSAFYEARGEQGIKELKLTCDYINNTYSDIPVILDFKRADIGSTNEQYANFAFNLLSVDAVTIQPYFGQEAVQVFLDYKDKGIIVLCKTSNTGSDEIQNLNVEGRKLYEIVAQNVAEKWNANGNCLLVVGATYPDDLTKIRQIVGPDMIILVPGIGAQGGDIEATLKAGINAQGQGLIINSGRDIIYASDGDDFAEAARNRAKQTQEEINKFRGVAN